MPALDSGYMVSTASVRACGALLTRLNEQHSEADLAANYPWRAALACADLPLRCETPAANKLG